MSRIFKNEEALRPEYIPDYLPFRENHLKKLELYFSQFLEKPGSVCPKVVLVGKTGTGKTVTARKFGQLIQEKYKSKNIRYVHVSCFLHRKLFAVLKEIGQQLNLPIPKRGLSLSDLIGLIVDMVHERDIYAIITLDDVFHLVNASDEEDQLGNLLKLSEEIYYKTGKYRFSFILISQDLTFIDRLDPSARSLLGNIRIEFEPYTKEQIYKILEQRAQLALNDGAYSEDILEMIADVAGVDEENSASTQASYRGDARFAIDVLWHAGKLAELEGSERILPEHVREALKQALPGVPREYIESLPLHKKLFLLAIVKALKMRKDDAYVPFGFVEEIYNMLCEQYGERPRKHTQLWEYLRELKSLGIVETRLSGKGRRGRTTLISIPVQAPQLDNDKTKNVSISIPSEPLDTLEKMLEEMIRKELSA